MTFGARKNSTNVRLPSPLDPWPLPPRARCAPGIALGLWTLVVAVACVEGVFARLEPEAFTALAAFAVAFTLLCAACDAEVRAIVKAWPHKLATALLLDVAIFVALAVSRDAGAIAWTALPAATALLVLLPLALVSHAAAAWSPRVRKAAAGSPGAKRAAT